MSTQRHQNRMGEHFREQEGCEGSLMEQCRQLTSESIRENPMAATLAAFGVGLGFGAIVGSMLAGSGAPSRRQTAETVGRRVLDSLADALPSSVRQHLHT